MVVHLDDNPRNFNIENLVNSPQQLNLMLKKSKGYQLKNGKWRASFTVGAEKQTSAAAVATQAEALYAVDILKGGALAAQPSRGLSIVSVLAFWRFIHAFGVGGYATSRNREAI